MKVRNLKANHNGAKQLLPSTAAVLSSMKVRNLKANHSRVCASIRFLGAVLASVKVWNSQHAEGAGGSLKGCISKCEGTESGS